MPLTARRESFDACVVGSGAGGAPVAEALTRAGMRVLVLEKGPRYTEDDFVHDELAICRRSFFVPSLLDEPRSVVPDGGGPAARSSLGWISCCVGGGTVHMSGFFYRLHCEDLRLASELGTLPGAAIADWPFDLDALEPFYDEAERILGVSGQTGANPFEPRRTPYPLGPLLAHPASALVEQAGARLGLHVFPTPRAVVSADYDGRPACAYCSFCGSYGCENRSKSSMPVTFLARAERTGRLVLRPRSMVTEVVTARDGRARGVRYLDGTGAQHEVSARVVVLACSAIETARLLLSSRGPAHRDGLANSSGAVGKNLMFLAYASGSGRFALPSPHFPSSARRLPFLDRSVQDFYLAPRAGLPYPKAGTLIFLLPHVNPIFQAERLASPPGSRFPVAGAALKRRLREFFLESATLEWEAFAEFLPNPGCEVTLDPDLRDRFGLPVARLRTGVHPASLAAADFLAQKGRAVLEATGANALASTTDEPIYPVLQAGTARMGHDPRDSVLDPTGRAHDVANLYVTDGSGFPSSGGAPFTLTIIANALRVASHIVARARRREL